MGFLGVMLANVAASTGGGGEPGTGEGMQPYIGIADRNAPRNTATILSLRQAQRGPNPSRVVDVFSITAEGNDGYWFAYPKIYGEATFYEADANGNVIGVGTGGWDGAKGDPFTQFGPLEVDLVIDGKTIPFYIYVSDWPGLGQMYWKVG